MTKGDGYATLKKGRDRDTVERCQKPALQQKTKKELIAKDNFHTTLKTSA